MPVAVREADLTSDRQSLISLAFDHLTRESTDQRFDWLYRRNPHGPARAWIAFEPSTGQTVGAAAAFPRVLQVEGQAMLGWVLGDFCVREEYRSLGPALALQRACLEDVRKGLVPLCYDFPSQRMLAIYKRLGVPAFGQIVRLAKPLRVDARIAKSVPIAPLAKALSVAGNQLLKLRSGRRALPAEAEAAVHAGPFGEEFSDLYRRLAGGYQVSGHRTADYLNWRYWQNPLRSYQTLTVRRREKLAAYAVFAVEEKHALVADLFGEKEGEVIQGLLTAVTDVVRQSAVSSLSVYLLETSPLMPVLLSAGFARRDATPIVVCAGGDETCGRLARSNANWFLTHGDRES